MNGNQSSQNREAAQGYRPKLSFYHPNARGTGCAVAMELHPAHDNKSGCIMMKLANQAATGERPGQASLGRRFDWEHGITVKLDFGDLCKLLQVLRGEFESVEDGKGLYHVTSKATTKIQFRHIVEPVTGYSLEVYRTSSGGEETRARILFSSAEALGLCEAISGSMAIIGFGIPMTIPHDTSAYEAEQRRLLDERAA